MSINKETVMVACASAVVGVAVSEIVRSIWFKKSRHRRTALARGEIGAKLREEEFNLEECFLNSGSWGPVPRLLQEKYQRFAQERESKPQTWFFHGRRDKLMTEAKERIAEYVGAKAADLVFVENTSTGTNTVLRNIKFERGDKIAYLFFHTYSAVVNQIKQTCIDNPGIEMIGIKLDSQPKNADEIISAYRQCLDENPSVKLVMVDHITSSTAILMPLKEIIKVCHDRGSLVCVDAAHGPGQIALKVESYGADFYIGNLCKWLLTPRGAGFIYIHPKHQATFSPFMVVHNHFKSGLHERFYIRLTADFTPYILAKDAIEFNKALGGPDVIAPKLRTLVTWAAEMLAEAWNTRVTPLPPELRPPGMLHVQLPQVFKKVHNPVSYKSFDNMELLIKKGVATFVMCIDDVMWCRLCCNVWNDKDDFYKLRDAVLEVKREIESK